MSALPTYELRARLANGTSEPIESLINAHLALFYETLLERALGIEDEPVEGELDRAEPRVRPAFVFFLLPPALWLGSCAVMGEGYGTLVEPIYLDAGPSEARLRFSTPVTLRFGSWLYFDQAKTCPCPSDPSRVSRAPRPSPSSSGVTARWSTRWSATPTT